jgi:Bacterial Ig domain
MRKPRQASTLIAVAFILFLLTFATPTYALIGGILQANDDHASTPANVPVTIDVLANDSCSIAGIPCPGGMVVQSAAAPSHGTAVVNQDNTVTYTPNQGFTGSDSFSYTASDSTGLLTGSATVYVTVTPHPTSTNTSPSSATLIAGGSITLTATVDDASQGSPSAPTGTVQWADGGAGGTFGPASCTLQASASSTSSCQTVYTAPYSPGAIHLAATYSGDSIHSVSSGTSSLTVTSATPADPTNTGISPSQASSDLGAQVKFTVTVTDTGSSPTSPTGTVAWSDGGAGGTFNSMAGATCTLSSATPATSSCSVVYVNSHGGTYSITADYPGDSAHAGSSGTASLTLTSHPTSTAVSSSSSTVSAGGTVTLTATVTDTSTTAGPTVPSGTVSWDDGGAGGSFSATSCTLGSGGTCQVTYTAPASPPSGGTVVVTGTYSGDSVHAASSGNTALAVQSATQYTISRESSGLVFLDPLNNATMSQQQLQAQGRYYFDGSAPVENAPYNFNEDAQGLHIGVQSTGPNVYAGFFAQKNFGVGTVFHAMISTPTRTIPSGYYDTGIYVQTGNGLISYVFCGAVTSAYGTQWAVERATSNNTAYATGYKDYWIDNSTNQALTRSCTIVTNGANYLAVYVDNSLVYSNSSANLGYTRPLQLYLEVQSSYPGQELYGTFTDFYVAAGTSVTVNNLPSGASSVQLVDQSGTVLASATVSNGVAVLNVSHYTYPISAKMVVQRSDGSALATSGVLSVYGGDVYKLQ